MKSLKNHKVTNGLVLIEWVDSSQPIAAWRHLNDLPSAQAIACRSVGWLLNDGKVKLLAPNLGDVESDGNAQASGIIRIPAQAITKITPLRVNASPVPAYHAARPAPRRRRRES